MRAEEIFKTKAYLDKNDIMKIYDCGESVALRIKREIKSVSDTTHCSKIVSEKDFYLWANLGTRSNEKSRERESSL
ncbi:MAG: hypothetical protein RR327_04195 [Clostridia bacterium]